MDPFIKSSVVKLSGADFENDEPWKLKDKKCSFVLFYANWCGHCQDLKPEYAKFANVAQYIKVYAVDADENKKILESINNSNSKFKVESFPTILLYSNGMPVEEYTGERNYSALNTRGMKFCKETCVCGN